MRFLNALDPARIWGVFLLVSASAGPWERGLHKQLEGAADPAAPSVLFRIPRGTQLLWTTTPPVLTMLPAGMAPRTQETG